MDLNFTPEDEAFRAEVRAFLESRLPARFAERVRAGQQLPKAALIKPRISSRRSPVIA